MTYQLLRMLGYHLWPVVDTAVVGMTSGKPDRLWEGEEGVALLQDRFRSYFGDVVGEAKERFDQLCAAPARAQVNDYVDAATIGYPVPVFVWCKDFAELLVQRTAAEGLMQLAGMQGGLDGECCFAMAAHLTGVIGCRRRRRRRLGVGSLRSQKGLWSSDYDRKSGVNLERFRVTKARLPDRSVWSKLVRAVRENSDPHLTTYGLVSATNSTAPGLVMVVMPRYEARAPREDEVGSMAKDVLRAVLTLHLRGVAHGDLRLSNIVKARSGGWVVIDYENAQVLTPEWREADFRHVAHIMATYMESMLNDPALFGLFLRIACGAVEDIERYIAADFLE
jgi:hypothetical protein